MKPSQFKDTRLSLGLTQSEWASWLGVGLVHVCRIETGKRKASVTLEKLAGAYASGWRASDAQL